jgi:hypothetical protein
MEACAWIKVWQQGIVQLHDGQRLRLTHRGHGENLSLHEFHVFALKESQGDELFVVVECPAIRADLRASDHHITAQEFDFLEHPYSKHTLIVGTSPLMPVKGGKPHNGSSSPLYLSSLDLSWGLVSMIRRSKTS